MTRPPDRVEAVTWKAVEGPVHCGACGHDHWSWTSSADPPLAPQWRFCDQPDCGCRTLRTCR